MKFFLPYIFAFCILGSLHAQVRPDSSSRSKVFNSNTFELKQNYPNPFSKSTQIEFYSVADQALSIKVYDMLGNVLVNKVIEAEKGVNYYSFERGNLPQGFYFYSLQSGNTVLTKRMMIRD